MSIGITQTFGRPGIGAALTAQRLNVSRNGTLGFFPGGGTIEGTVSRDPGNTDIFNLRPGLLMGKITSGGFYAPSIIGVLTDAVSADYTSLTVSAAQAAYLVSRIGATGTLRVVGPPTANGTVATYTTTYTAVNTSTGAVTISSGTKAALAAGSFVVPNDGSQTPITFIPDGYSHVVPDNSADIEFPMIPVSGVVDVANLIPWPTDTSLRTWIRTNLSTASGGKFVFSDQF